MDGVCFQVPVSIEGTIDDGIQRLESRRLMILQPEMERVGADLDLPQFQNFSQFRVRIWDLGWLLSVMVDSHPRKMEALRWVLNPDVVVAKL